MHRNEAINARHTERSIFHINELFEHLMIEGKLMYVIDTVREESKKTVGLFCRVLTDQLFNCDLESFGQIKRVRKVE